MEVGVSEQSDYALLFGSSCFCGFRQAGFISYNELKCITLTGSVGPERLKPRIVRLVFRVDFTE